MESIEHSGLWWLPDSPDRKVAGTLKFMDKEGGRLELIGSFRDGREPMRGACAYPIILGFSMTRGRAITLLDCGTLSESAIRTGGDEPHEQFRVQSLYINAALIGARFGTTDEMRFDRAVLDLSNLRDWVDSYAGDVQEDEAAEDGGGVLRVTHTWPAPSRAVTSRGTVSLWHSPKVTYLGSGGANVEKGALFEVVSGDELTFDAWQERFVMPLQTFVSLVTGKWSSIDRLFLSASCHSMRGQIEAHYMQPSYNATDEAWGPPLLMMEQVAADFGGVLDRWLTITERYQAPCELFFAVMRTPNLFLENQFLNLVQAAESFHRIRSGNDAALRVRLTELVEDVHRMVPWVTGRRGPDGEWPFVDIVVKTRNYYTHRNEVQRHQAAHGRELAYLSACLMQLVHAILLREVQLPESVYQGLFRSRKLGELPGRRW